MVFGNGVKNIQAAAYNGARTVDFISIVNITSEAGFPPLDSQRSSTCLPSTVFIRSPVGINLGGSGGTSTVNVAYWDLMGLIPSAAPI